MCDTDILDILFEPNNSIIQAHYNCSEKLPESDSSVGTYDTCNSKMTLAASARQSSFDVYDTNCKGFIDDLEWPSSILGSQMDDISHIDLTSLMQSNLSDDVKEQQMSLPCKDTISDHAYSATPSSPNSDSGISAGSYSPPSSSCGIEDIVPIDFEKELFEPLDLKSYESDNLEAINPMLLDSWSETCSSPEGMHEDESPISFSFDDLLDKESSPQVRNLTTCTDEATKVIKVISVNQKKLSQSLLPNGNITSSQLSTNESPYPELRLADEEKDLLRKEGITLPSHLPLTREEEKVLRSIRRRIRNKASARNSRRKKQDYMEALENRVKLCTEEKRQLEIKVNNLEKKNSSLVVQLRKLQKLVSESTRQTARTGTCAMILALSFALVLFPNYQSFSGNASEKALLSKPASGRTSRNLLSKDIITSLQDDVSVNIPFLNFNKMTASVPKDSSNLVDEPVEDRVEEASYSKYLNKRNEELDTSTKVIHMEITKMPENVGNAKDVNTTHVVSKAEPDDVVRHRSIRMDLDDEL